MDCLYKVVRPKLKCHYYPSLSVFYQYDLSLSALYHLEENFMCLCIHILIVYIVVYMYLYILIRQASIVRKFQ